MNHMEVDTKKTGYNGGDITIITGAGAHENDETAAGFAGDMIFRAGRHQDNPERELFRVKPSGEIVLAPDVEMAEAARLFWEAVNMVKAQFVTRKLSGDYNGEDGPR